MSHGPVTAIVVSYADPQATLAAVKSLLSQSLPPIEVLVVDNDPGAATLQALASRPLPQVQALHPGINAGYTGAVNLAAQRAHGEWLFMLNPDASADVGCLQHLLDSVDGPDVAIVGAQILLPDGRINAGENPVNLSGISWSGGYGGAREHGPARDAAAVSGAALLVRRESFLRVGGLCPHFFMYVDDTDLAWRMRLAGMRVRYCPKAVVTHDYEFQKGSHKWFYLERNRVWALLANLQLRSLALLGPLLLATEAAVLIHAITQRRPMTKLRAWASLLRRAPELIRWRRAVQATRNVSDYEVLTLFCGGMQTELVDAGLPRWANACLESHRRAVLAVLRPRIGAAAERAGRDAVRRGQP